MIDSVWRLYRRFRPYMLKLGVHRFLKQAFWGLFDLATPRFVEISHGRTSINYRYQEPRQAGSLSFPEYPQFLESLKPSDVFYDIGAYRGIYTCFAAKCRPEMRVITIEPGPAIDTLKENITENGLVQADVEQVAFGETRDAFTVPQSGGDQMVTLVDERNNGTKIPVVPGDEFVQQSDYPIPTVTKIDVEGAEGRIIRGMKNVLTAPESRLVFLELHYPNDGSEPSTHEYGDDPRKILELLNDYGYDTTEVGRRRSQRFYRCERNYVQETVLNGTS